VLVARRRHDEQGHWADFDEVGEAGPSLSRRRLLQPLVCATKALRD